MADKEPTVEAVIVTIHTNGDGKDDDTYLFAWTSLVAGSQFSHGDFTSGTIDQGAQRTVNMVVDARPTRAQVEGGFQLRLKWNSNGHYSFHGDAKVTIVFSDNVIRNWIVPDIAMNQDVEWYIYPITGGGTDAAVKMAEVIRG
jgi:hypothetical protein